MADPLRALLRRALLMSADELATAVASEARALGAREAVIYLVDHEQAHLVPVPNEHGPGRQSLRVEGTVGGLAYRRGEVIAALGRERPSRLWVPLINGSERLGALELIFATPVPDVEEEARLLAALVAELIVVKDSCSDAFSRLRRRRTPSLAAEIQWELLPPLTFSTDRVTIAGALEPAYEIGGDSFDYAVTGDHADVAIFDAVGHGLPAAMMASLAVNAYRHARREKLDLPDIAVAINDVLAGHLDGSRFVTALLARLDLETGVLACLNAGHPEPLLLRNSTLVPPPACRPCRPLGLQEVKPICCETRLQPGDRLLLYTDGIVEARTPGGETFGEDRLADLLTRAEAAGDPPPETMRRLVRQIMEHQADQLQDDGTAVLIEWRGGRRRNPSSA